MKNTKGVMYLCLCKTIIGRVLTTMGLYLSNVKINSIKELPTSSGFDRRVKNYQFNFVSLIR